MALWYMWAYAWFPLFVANPIVLLIQIVNLMRRPTMCENWCSLACRVCSVPVAGFACYVILAFIPDV